MLQELPKYDTETHTKWTNAIRKMVAMDLEQPFVKNAVSQRAIKPSVIKQGRPVLKGILQNC